MLALIEHVRKGVAERTGVELELAWRFGDDCHYPETEFGPMAQQQISRNSGLAAFRRSAVHARARILWRPQHRGPMLAAVGDPCGDRRTRCMPGTAGARPATTRPEYIVTPDKILVTPQPKWIHADVKAEVVRVGEPQPQLDLRDPQLVEQLSRPSPCTLGRESRSRSRSIIPPGRS